jgi:hypothetical protein
VFSEKVVLYALEMIVGSTGNSLDILSACLDILEILPQIEPNKYVCIFSLYIKLDVSIWADAELCIILLDFVYLL